MYGFVRGIEVEISEALYDGFRDKGVRVGPDLERMEGGFNQRRRDSTMMPYDDIRFWKVETA